MARKEGQPREGLDVESPKTQNGNPRVQPFFHSQRQAQPPGPFALGLENRWSMGKPGPPK